MWTYCIVWAVRHDPSIGSCSENMNRELWTFKTCDVVTQFKLKLSEEIVQCMPNLSVSVGFEVDNEMVLHYCITVTHKILRVVSYYFMFIHNFIRFDLLGDSLGTPVLRACLFQLGTQIACRCESKWRDWSCDGLETCLGCISTSVPFVQQHKQTPATSQRTEVVR